MGCLKSLQRGRGLTCGIVLSMMGHTHGADDQWMPTVMWQCPSMKSTKRENKTSYLLSFQPWLWTDHLNWLIAVGFPTPSVAPPSAMSHFLTSQEDTGLAINYTEFKCTSVLNC